MSVNSFPEVMSLLEDLEPFVRRALPTHVERGGEADRQALLGRLLSAIEWFHGPDFDHWRDSEVPRVWKPYEGMHDDDGI